MSILCLVMHVLCVYAVKLLTVIFCLFWDTVCFFGEKRLATFLLNADLGFFVSFGVVGFSLKICFFPLGEILEMHVVLMYFPLKNIIVSQGSL